MTKTQHINIKNRRATFDYLLEDKFVAGLVLTGSEIKSIREGKANLTDGFCHFHRHELWVKGLHIAPYKQASYNGHEEMRDRKLLLNKRELKKIRKKLEEKGFTLIPTRLFLNDRGFAKLEIALAKGKKQYDKRESLKKKDSQRELDRIKNQRY
ncbi:MAG: SsrA-binding protein SmpB [Saprospiraceae bacterium]|nr:SsrA-binding protein SmpB [Saprospiraceae bacterium]